MNDRELLELSAKAIGYELHVNYVNASQLYKDGEYVCFWAPLEDDGDALRLAAALKIDISFFEGYQQVLASTYCCTHEAFIDYTEDRARDVRLAITTVAALAGEAMS